MRWRDWLSTRITALAIAIAVLILGGGVRWVQAIIAFVMVAALVPLVTSRRVLGRMSPLVAMLCIAIGLCVIQIVPLPSGLVAWLSPTEAALREDGTALVHTSALSTISYDVPGTLRAIAFFLILLGVALVALRLAASEHGRYRVVAFIAGTCGAGALVIGVHAALGVRELYGMFTPTNGAGLIGPLFNLNHLGCVMALGANAALGLVFYRKQRSWLRVVWLVVTGMCALATLATLSRGAALSLAVGAFVTIAVLVAQRWLANDDVPRRRANFLTSSLPIVVVATCTVVVVLYAGSGGISQQLSQTHFTEIEAPRSKFAAWRSTTKVIEESPWVGIGRGAFEPVFTRVHPASGYSTFSNVENEYLQAAVDWGVPGALLLAFATMWMVAIAVRRWRDGPLAAGALGAVVVVMLQSNVDYGVELLGIAMPITALVATLTYVPLVEVTQRELAVRRGLRVVHVIALAIMAVLLCTPKTTSLDEDHAIDQTALSLDQLRGPLERHPLDYFNYALAAQVMIRDRDRDAIRVLNHAMTLHPTHSGLHLIAAHLLLDTKHPDQAAVEYASAFPASKNHDKLVAEIVRRFTPAQAAVALPVTPLLIDEIARILNDQKHDDVAIVWLDHILDLHPQTAHACDLLFAIAARTPDRAAAIVDDRRCAKYDPSHETRLALAKTLIAKQSYPEAIKLVEDVESWQSAIDLKLEAWLALCDTEVGQQRWDDARKCLRRLDTTGIVPTARSAEVANRLERIDQATHQ